MIKFEHLFACASRKTTSNLLYVKFNRFFRISSSNSNFINIDNVNQNVRKLEYAVRGPLVIRAVALRKELESDDKFPFKSVISANIGDCHAMQQKPITFIRQVVSCASDTSRLSDPNVPNDVKERVRELLSSCSGGSVGSYSDSCGIEVTRRHVAKYIEKRDGIETDWQNVFLSTGASEAIKNILSLVNHSRKQNSKAGVMIPIPQYPLYSATLCEFGIEQVNYYLNEDDDWRLDIDELRRAYETSKHKCDIRCLVVINPGNPTGSVLSEENIVEILKFANEKGLMIIADEVYQHNVYAENAKFNSFKRVLKQKTKYNIEIASMMSASKGFMGECGLRGGYCELTNFNLDVRAILYKELSSWLCSSVLGQITMDCIVNPPKPGDESFDLFEKEKNKILQDLKHKAKLVADTFNSVEGVKSNKVAGAMYAFPKLDLPPKAIEAAKKANQAPDFHYAMQFLENHGVCVVPGSGFGQMPGTYHFRTTILPQPDLFEDMMDRFRKHHSNYMQKYS